MIYNLYMFYNLIQYVSDCRIIANIFVLIDKRVTVFVERLLELCFNKHRTVELEIMLTGKELIFNDSFCDIIG